MNRNRLEKSTIILIIASVLLCCVYIFVGITEPGYDPVVDSAMKEAKSIRKEIRKGIETDKVEGFNIYYKTGDEDSVYAGTVVFDGEKHRISLKSVSGSTVTRNSNIDITITAEAMEKIIDNVLFIETVSKDSGKDEKMKGRDAVEYIERAANSTDLNNRLTQVAGCVTDAYCLSSMKGLQYARQTLSASNSDIPHEYASAVMARFNKYSFS